jgi:hypothetical protein
MSHDTDPRLPSEVVSITNDRLLVKGSQLLRLLDLDPAEAESVKLAKAVIVVFEDGSDDQDPHNHDERN